MLKLSDFNFKELRQRQFGTDRELAAAIVPELEPDEFGSRGVPNEESVRRYFSLLANQEETTWWENHPSATKALAKHLAIPLEDLPFWRGRISDESLITFEEFPQLPPLDPRTEEPCKLATFDDGLRRRAAPFDAFLDFHWHKPPSSLDTTARWLRVPDGAGKHFVAKYHRTSNTYEVHELETIEEADGYLGESRPLLLVLNKPSANEIAHDVAHKLAAQDNVLVLASFWPPGMSETDFAAQNRLTEERKRGSWWCGEWCPLPQMRGTLVRWVERRLEAHEKMGLFEAGAVLTWLGEHDPNSQLFSTPSDILTVCREAFDGQRTLSSLTTADFAEKWLRRRLAARKPDRQRVEADSEHLTVDSVRRICKEWLRDTSLPWREALSSKQWQALVMHALALPATEKHNREELYEQLEAPSAPEGRKAIIEKLRALDRQSADTVVQRLVEIGFLSWRDSRHLQAGPPWLLVILACADIIEMITEGAVEQWGSLAARADRQPIVDFAWGSLAPDDRARSIDHLLEEVDTDGLADIAALESVFVLVAWRLSQGEELDHEMLARLVSLCHHAWSQSVFVQLPYRTSGPLTRRPTLHDKAEVLLHLFNCWTICLAVDKPSSLDLAGLEWAFPVWNKGELPAPPSWLMEVSSAFEAPRHAHTTVALTAAGTRAFLKLTRRMYEHLDGQVEEWPRFMLPATLLEAPSSSEPIDIRDRLEIPHLADWIADELTTVSGERREEICRVLWRAAILGSRFHPTEFVEALETLGPLQSQVLANLSLETLFAEQIRANDRPTRASTIEFLLRGLGEFEAPDHLSEMSDLPMRMRKWLYRWVRENQEDWLSELAKHFVDQIQPDPETIRLLTQNEHEFFVFPEHLWQVAPHKALRFAIKHYELDPDKARRWFVVVPLEQVDSLFVQIGDTPAQAHASWMKQWVADHLPFARSNAEQMWEWLRA